MGNREAVLTRRILKYLNTRPNTKAIRLNQDQSQSGNPDILCVVNGAVLFLEVKKVDGVLSKLQKQKIEEWRGVGASCCVVRSLSQAQEEWHSFSKLVDSGKMIYEVF